MKKKSQSTTLIETFQQFKTNSHLLVIINDSKYYFKAPCNLHNPIANTGDVVMFSDVIKYFFHVKLLDIDQINGTNFMIPKREIFILFEGTRDTSDMFTYICGTSSCLVILRYNCATLIRIILLCR